MIETKSTRFHVFLSDLSFTFLKICDRWSLIIELQLLSCNVRLTFADLLPSADDRSPTMNGFAERQLRMFLRRSPFDRWSFIAKRLPIARFHWSQIADRRSRSTPIAGRWSLIADRRSIADRGSSIAARRSQIISYSFEIIKFQSPICPREVPYFSFGFRTADFGLRTSNLGLCTSNFGLRSCAEISVKLKLEQRLRRGERLRWGYDARHGQKLGRVLV